MSSSSSFVGGIDSSQSKPEKEDDHSDMISVHDQKLDKAGKGESPESSFPCESSSLRFIDKASNNNTCSSFSDFEKSAVSSVASYSATRDSTTRSTSQSSLNIKDSLSVNSSNTLVDSITSDLHSDVSLSVGLLRNPKLEFNAIRQVKEVEKIYKTIRDEHQKKRNAMQVQLSTPAPYKSHNDDFFSDSKLLNQHVVDDDGRTCTNGLSSILNSHLYPSVPISRGSSKGGAIKNQNNFGTEFSPKARHYDPLAASIEHHVSLKKTQGGDPKLDGNSKDLEGDICLRIPEKSSVRQGLNCSENDTFSDASFHSFLKKKDGFVPDEAEVKNLEIHLERQLKISEESNSERKLLLLAISNLHQSLRVENELETVEIEHALLSNEGHSFLPHSDALNNPRISDQSSVLPISSTEAIGFLRDIQITLQRKYQTIDILRSQVSSLELELSDAQSRYEDLSKNFDANVERMKILNAESAQVTARAESSFKNCEKFANNETSSILQGEPNDNAFISLPSPHLDVDNALSNTENDTLGIPNTPPIPHNERIQSINSHFQEDQETQLKLLLNQLAGLIDEKEQLGKEIITLKENFQKNVDKMESMENGLSLKSEKLHKSCEMQISEFHRLMENQHNIFLGKISQIKITLANVGLTCSEKFPRLVNQHHIIKSELNEMKQVTAESSSQKILLDNLQVSFDGIMKKLQEVIAEKMKLVDQENEFENKLNILEKDFQNIENERGRLDRLHFDKNVESKGVDGFHSSISSNDQDLLPNYSRTRMHSPILFSSQQSPDMGVETSSPKSKTELGRQLDNDADHSSPNSIGNRLLAFENSSGSGNFAEGELPLSNAISEGIPKKMPSDHSLKDEEFSEFATQVSPSKNDEENNPGNRVSLRNTSSSSLTSAIRNEESTENFIDIEFSPEGIRSFSMESTSPSRGNNYDSSTFPSNTLEENQNMLAESNSHDQFHSTDLYNPLYSKIKEYEKIILDLEHENEEQVSALQKLMLAKTDLEELLTCERNRTATLAAKLNKIEEEGSSMTEGSQMFSKDYETVIEELEKERDDLIEKLKQTKADHYLVMDDLVQRYQQLHERHNELLSNQELKTKHSRGKGEKRSESLINQSSQVAEPNPKEDEISKKDRRSQDELNAKEPSKDRETRMLPNTSGEMINNNENQSSYQDTYMTTKNEKSSGNLLNDLEEEAAALRTRCEILEAALQVPPPEPPKVDSHDEEIQTQWTILPQVKDPFPEPSIPERVSLTQPANSLHEYRIYPTFHIVRRPRILPLSMYLGTSMKFGENGSYLDSNADQLKDGDNLAAITKELISKTNEAISLHNEVNELQVKMSDILIFLNRIEVKYPFNERDIQPVVKLVQEWRHPEISLVEGLSGTIPFSDPSLDHTLSSQKNIIIPDNDVC